MTTEWIAFLEASLVELVLILLQLAYCLVLLSVAVGLTVVLCAPFIWMYCAWLVHQEDKAKRSAPSDPANAAGADQVKGRAPGLSEHAPSFGQTEARAERTLERPPP